MRTSTTEGPPRPRRTRGGTTGAGLLASLIASSFGAAGLGVSCYNPKVVSGHLMCAAPPAKACPDDFECQGGRCVSAGLTGPGTGGAGTGGIDGSGGNPGTGGTPGTGGAAPDAGMRVHEVGETCTISNRGQPNQSDDCDVNLLCVDDCAGARCYQYCQNDADCPASSCTRTTPDKSRQLCEIPFTPTCDQQDGHTGCANVAQGCYLVSPLAAPTGGSRLVCDCSMGSGTSNVACSDSRDCFPGYVCPPMGSGPGSGFCQRVCNPTATDSGCQAGTSCHAFGSTWGYCF